MRLLLFAVVSVAVAVADEPNDVLIGKFKDFVKAHSKQYESVHEMLHRIAIYARNLVKVREMQMKDQSARYSHTSKFMDISPEEFKKRNGYGIGKPLEARRPAPLLSTANTPTSYDWRQHGAVNAVKDQGQCGSCWAFGTVANVEGVHVVQGKGSLLSLSEQELVDCSKSDYGCNGGLPDNAYSDLIQSKTGLVLESDYGYEAQDGSCRMQKYPQKVFITSYHDISTDEDQIAAALVKYGPLVIGINANPMQFYSGGIANPPDCSPQELDHAVNIVGFGEENGQKYWTIRNSWGASWGEDGYYRIVRGVGRCGLNADVSTAIIDSQAVVV